jgi:hypothetical protein
MQLYHQSMRLWTVLTDHQGTAFNCFVVQTDAVAARHLLSCVDGSYEVHLGKVSKRHLM